MKLINFFFLEKNIHLVPVILWNLAIIFFLHFDWCIIRFRFRWWGWERSGHLTGLPFRFCTLISLASFWMTLGPSVCLELIALKWFYGLTWVIYNSFWGFRIRNTFVRIEIGILMMRGRTVKGGMRVILVMLISKLIVMKVPSSSSVSSSKTSTLLIIHLILLIVRIKPCHLIVLPILWVKVSLKSWLIIIPLMRRLHLVWYIILLTIILRIVFNLIFDFFKLKRWFSSFPLFLFYCQSLKHMFLCVSRLYNNFLLLLTLAVFYRYLCWISVVLHVSKYYKYEIRIIS